MEKNWVDSQLAKLAPDTDWQPNVSRAFARLKQRQSGGARWIWLAPILAASCVGVLAFPAPRAVCVNACSVLFQKKLAKPVAADFTVKDASGTSFRLSDYKGKVVLLNFWATYCVPCRAEIPWLIEFEKTYKDKGFAVIGISMDEDWDQVKPYLAEKHVNYRIGLGNDELAQKYGGIDALPETFLIDREGKIVTRHVGMVSKPDTERDIAQALGK